MCISAIQSNQISASSAALHAGAGTSYRQKETVQHHPISWAPHFPLSLEDTIYILELKSQLCLPV